MFLHYIFQTLSCKPIYCLGSLQGISFGYLTRRLLVGTAYRFVSLKRMLYIFPTDIRFESGTFQEGRKEQRHSKI